MREQTDTIEQQGDTAPVRASADAQLPAAARIHTREILGIPMAMTDYTGAMDVMDEMVARRERGWVCAAAVHSVMVAQDDPRDARRRSRSS